MTYDALNRRTQASYADGSIATFTYDAADRLTQADDIADPHRPITRTYDPLDRLLTETTTLGTVSYAYDPAGPGFESAKNSKFLPPSQQGSPIRGVRGI